MSSENKVVENLLKHVYSRSVAEVIHRLLHILETNFDDDLSAQISQQKQFILTSLIEQLNCEREDETVMNAAFILQDILEQKPFFQILTKRANMQKLFNTAFRKLESGDYCDADSSFVTQGLIVRFVQQFNERQKSNNDDDDDPWHKSDDDDIIVNEVSDEEGDDAKNGNAAAVMELMTEMIVPLKEIISKATMDPIQTQFSSSRTLPLGRTKLRAIEVLQAIMSLKKAPIADSVAEKELMPIVLSLIEKHQWNNMLQLKADLIFDDLFATDMTAAQKLNFLAKAKVTSALASMSKTPEVSF